MELRCHAGRSVRQKLRLGGRRAKTTQFRAHAAIDKFRRQVRQLPLSNLGGCQSTMLLERESQVALAGEPAEQGNLRDRQLTCDQQAFGEIQSQAHQILMWLFAK